MKTAKDHERWIYDVWKLEKKGNFIKENFNSYPLRPEQNGCGCTGVEEGFHSKGKWVNSSSSWRAIVCVVC